MWDNTTVTLMLVQWVPCVRVGLRVLLLLLLLSYILQIYKFIETEYVGQCYCDYDAGAVGPLPLLVCRSGSPDY